MQFFMWLVVHSRCLTWDNLCKHGFQGHSMCVLCRTSEENVSHLFFQCSFTRHIWHSWWNVWNQSYWNVSSIAELFARWHKAPVKTSFLQVAWTLGPSFIIWHIWLERSPCIFKDEFLEVPHLWCKILHSLGETISAKCDTSEAMEPGEDIFNNHLNIPPSHGKLLRNMCRHPLRKINRVGKWSAPPQGVLKINTDGSSKGNLGPAGISGVGRDSTGDVQFLFSIYKSHHTNNLMEAMAILYPVKNACDLGWRRLICESDSQVVIRLLNQEHSKVVSWKLALIADQIHNLCISLEFVTFTHITREWNSVDDCRAKWASDHMCNWNIVDKTQLLMGFSHQFDHLVDLDRVV